MYRAFQRESALVSACVCVYVYTAPLYGVIHGCVCFYSYKMNIPAFLGGILQQFNCLLPNTCRQTTVLTVLKSSYSGLFPPWLTFVWTRNIIIMTCSHLYSTLCVLCTLQYVCAGGLLWLCSRAHTLQPCPDHSLQCGRHHCDTRPSA